MAASGPQNQDAPDAVAVALRQRRLRRLGIGVAILALASSSVYSHLRTPGDPSTMDGQPVVVDRVIDGDTVVISGSGFTDQRLRLRGIDAPEVVHPEFDRDDHFGPESKAYLTGRLINPKKPLQVTLKFDGTERRDRFGRLLGYLYLGDSDCINVDLVRDGMAYADRRFKSMLQSTLEEAENNARIRKIGLWKDLRPQDMPAWRQKWLEKQRPTK